MSYKCQLCGSKLDDEGYPVNKLSLERTQEPPTPEPKFTLQQERVTLYWDEMEKLWFVCKDGVSIGDQSWLDNEKFHAECYAAGLRAELAKEDSND